MRPINSFIIAAFVLEFGLSFALLPEKIRVGSVFLERDQEIHRAFRLAVDSLKPRNLLNDTKVEFDIQFVHYHDFFHLYTRACLEVNYRIISLFGPNEKNLDQMLESISTNLGIPYLSIAPRPQLTNGNHEGSEKLSISLHPTQNQLIRLIKDMTAELGWKDASIIHDPVHGIIQPSLLAESLQFLGPVSIHQVSVDLRATLVQLRLRGARNIIIDTSVDDLPTVTQAALDTGMMTKSYTYIFTMLDMKSGNWSRLTYSEALVFGFNIIDERKFQEFEERFAPMSPTTGSQMGLEDKTKVALTLDAVELMARGLEAFDDSRTELSQPPPTSCTDDKKWELGEELLDAFTSVSFDGITGPISLSSGTRVKLFVEILKLNYEYTQTMNPFIQPIGNWSVGINYDYEGIFIPDKSLLTNDRSVINKSLLITTISSPSCYSRNENGDEQGFCVDLAYHLSKLVGFTFKFKVVADNRYGKPDAITGTWNGMIGEVMRGEADLAIADLTITASRSSVVDFSVPFLQTSLGILYKDVGVRMDEMGTLLSPFSTWVWLSILIAFFITSIALRLVAWLSPIEKEDIIVAGSDSRSSLVEELSWINSMWILSSTLVLRGTDIRIRAASSRTITVVWWIFSLVVIFLYASLVSHWFDPDSSSAKSHTLDSLLKQKIEFGVTQSSSTSFLLQNAKSEGLQKLWWKIQKSGSERNFQESVADGIQEVLNSDGKFAFISEEKNLNAARIDDCSLKILGPIDKRSFGVAFQKGSTLRDRVSQAIITLGETGILRQLETKWWETPDCEENGGRRKLNFVHFIGPLCLLSTGIIIAIIIAMGERLMHHRKSHRGFFRTHTEPRNGKIAMNDTESDE